MRAASTAWLLLAILLVTMATVSAADPGQPDAARRRVAELITQLGAPKYIARQAAQRELQGLGLVAFDQLLAAVDDPDPEVAAASRRLLEDMTVRWAQPGDSPRVRQLLESYSRQDEGQRREVVEELASLEDSQGVSALCRIARFDASEGVSREAAIAVIDTRDFSVSDQTIEAVSSAETALEAKYGPSRRVAGQWLRLLRRQKAADAETIKSWRLAIAAEQRDVDDSNPDTSESNVVALRWNLLRVQLQARQYEQLLPVVDLLMTGERRQAELALEKALDWMVEAKADQAVDKLLTSRREQLTSKRGLYVAAAIRQKQGRREESEQLAEQASEIDSPAEDAYHKENRMVLDGRVFVALRLEGEGHAEWAQREYRRAALKTPVLSTNAICARWRLSSSLSDYERYPEAAQALTTTLEAIGESEQSKRLYKHLQSEFEELDELMSVDGITARRDYCQALAARQSGDFTAEAKLLQSAIEHDPGDADILIAMHRASGGDEAFRADTSLRIRELSNVMQESIDEEPDDPIAYNQWAWLVSNTEGDFSQAVRYSRKSLELDPENPSFLDTLGRCYFAVGDLQQAVAVQRRAVEIQPHIMVMQRQLKEFEAALEASRAEKASD